MKTTFNLLLAAALIGFTACSDGDNKTSNTNSTSVPANTNNFNTATPSANVALNPPHGEPGHRCEIEVGAPLNTPAQPKLTTPQPTFQPQQPSGSVAAGTNPPHGQPGHDCAVPVGAPLPK
jgi:hypothetical protein